MGRTILQNTALEIAKVIRDYDVCYMIATLFIDKRKKESEEKARYWHNENLIKQIYSRSWSPKDNPSLPNTPHCPSHVLKEYRKADDPNLERNIMYMASERGIRTKKWRLYCSILFGEGNDEFNNQNVDFRRKAKDIDILGSRIIKQFITFR